MKKVIESILVAIVVVIIIGMSVLLLSYNEYRVSEFGNKTILLLDEDMIDFKEGSAIIVEKKTSDEYEAGDYVFYYDTTSTDVKTVLGQITSIYQIGENGADNTYKMSDGFLLSEEYIIGKKENTKEYKTLGKVLRVLESKWGNLFLVVVPAAVLFLYEIYNVIVAIKVYKMGKKEQA